jgi:Fur family peroxide stress response transcriptional regulator
MKPRLRANSKTMPPPGEPRSADDTIHGAGLRMTEQRRAVFDALLDKRDHPTAVDVFTRVRGRMPAISLATVYNCLDTLTACGLVKTVQIDRGPARYCPNLEEHAHFHCEECGTVLDLPLRTRRHPQDVWELPEDLSITGHEVAFRGICPTCAHAHSTKTKNS